MGQLIYKVSQLRVECRGPVEQDRPPDPEGGIAPPLEIYRATGHRHAGEPILISHRFADTSRYYRRNSCNRICK
jgi:hypothetical protein